MDKKYVTLFLAICSTIYSYGQCSPDVTPPTISCMNKVAACPHGVGSVAPTTSDNCGIVLQTYTLTGATVATSPATGINDASSVNFLAGTTTVNYYIEDAAGNPASCSFTVTVNDFTKPIVVCQGDQTTSNDSGQCTAFVDMYAFDVFPTAFDSCSGLSTVATGIPPGGNFPVGTTTVIWVVTDAAGNFETCTQNVTVIDDEAPNILCPSNITVSTTLGQCNANVNVPLAVATDNCSITSITNSFNSGGSDASGLYPLGTTTVTFEAIAADGRTANCSFDVTVVNTQNPIISLQGPDPLIIEACGAYTEYGAMAIDNCAGDISGSIIIDASAVQTNVVGSYFVTYNVSNASGNLATQIVRTVNVVDSTAPSLNLIGPNPLTVGDCSSYTELGAEAIDVCFGDISGTVIIDNSNVNTSVLGSYTVTYNVVDASGNAASQITRIVEVIDVSGPNITLMGANPQIIDLCSPYLELGAIAVDPCFNVDYSSDIAIDISAINFNVTGTYPVTYNVTDSSGNMGEEVVRTIEIVDSVTPTLTCPGNMILDADVGSCTTIVNYNLTVVDNCPGETIVQTSGLPSGSAFPIGTTTNTFELTDAHGNTATCSFDVTINDTELPVAICQDITMLLDPITGLLSLTPSDIDNGSRDNCSFNLSLSQSSFDCTNIGTNIITLTITDDSGNSSSCSSEVTITDLSENASVSILSSTSDICQNESVTFTATSQDGGTSPSYQWQINGIDEVGEISDTFTSTALSNGDVITVLMTSSLSVCAQPQISNGIVISVNEYNAPAYAGPNMTNTICTETSVTLAGNLVTGSGSMGLWTVTSGQTSGFLFSDATSPTSTFTGEIGEAYTLTWTIDNPAPCPDTSSSTTITFIGCNALDFDGIDDNITFRDNYNFGGDFSIEVWIKSDVTNGNIQTILAKREANNLVDGYDLRLVNNTLSFNWNNGESLSSPFPILTNRWYHVALTFGSGSYNLYIDGVVVNSTTGFLPITNSMDFIVGAMDQTLVAPFRPLHYFDGGTDELRIWNTALSTEQIRKMMNQEIEDNLGNVRGTVVPMDVPGVSWADLMSYYQMNQVTDITSGNLTPSNGSSINGILRYMTTLQPDTAPIPFQTVTSGMWTDTNVWLHGDFQSIPNSFSVDGSTLIDWNIVKTTHDIDSGNNNITVLGLAVMNGTVTIANSDIEDGQSLRVTDYLIINDELRLVGESQLLQDTESVVDYNGAGILKRDQQGTSNLYNYNYWGSPVSLDGTTFSIENVLFDGLQPVQWTTAHNANPTTTPITLSNRWLYLYENYPENVYADWHSINEDHLIKVGLGYLMKGSGATGTMQNYTFVGQPNNGMITTPITGGYEALVGNPYPSAIDANEFIDDNSSSIQGALYFWEHYVTNATHVLANYQGGFAVYNLLGGNPAVSPPEISGLGVSSKVPERYIPVAQGFSVLANAVGGNVVFENDQRVFVKESVTGAANDGSVFMRGLNLSAPHTETENAIIKRIRLEFKGPSGNIRSLLLGFVSNNIATDGFDYGYDALNTDIFSNDMSWMIEGKRYVIQGVGDFTTSKKIALGLFLSHSGTIEIALKAFENFESQFGVDVYVYDALTETSTLINHINYNATLNAADYLDRFFITFEPNSTLSAPFVETDDNTMVNYLHDSEELYIKINSNLQARQVQLFNILGQKVATYKITDSSTLSNEIYIPISNISEGIYIVKIETNTSQTINKRVLISF